MKLLIVEGNPKSIWQTRLLKGGRPYHRRFSEMLYCLGYNDVSFAFPADNEQLPTLENLRKFNGILLTGSALNVYDSTPEVTRQLDFAEQCFLSGVPIYGSCWGLQVAVMSSGGRITRSKKGREFGIAQEITLTKAGKKSPFFTSKPDIFDAYCIHEDDTLVIPENTEVLATNHHSKVQALTINYRSSTFFGVQYHPEFVWEDIAFLANEMQVKLNEEGIFNTTQSKSSYLNRMIDAVEINQFDFRTREIANWLLFIKNQ